MARTMVPVGADEDEPPCCREPTRLDRRGQQILAEINKTRVNPKCPREEIVGFLLSYIDTARERFPGESCPEFKRYRSGENVLEDFEFAELTMAAYMGHFAMMYIRDEFPTDLFVLETTKFGPRLVVDPFDKYDSENRNHPLVLKVRDSCC